MHSCAECGIEHDAPEPVIVDDGDQAEVAETVADSSVEVARINADRDVAVAKISARMADEEIVAAFSAMQARIDVLEASQIPPEPVPVPVPVPEPEPEPEPVPAPEETEPKAEHKAKTKRGFF